MKTKVYDDNDFKIEVEVVEPKTARGRRYCEITVQHSDSWTPTHRREWAAKGVMNVVYTVAQKQK